MERFEFPPVPTPAGHVLELPQEKTDSRAVGRVLFSDPADLTVGIH